MVEREDMDLQSQTITTSTARDFPGRHDPVDDTGSMQVLLAAAGLREIPASRHGGQSQRYTSRGSPTMQAIPGSLHRHDTSPALDVNRQETFAANGNPTGPLGPHMASERGLGSSQDATSHFANDSAASVEPVNSAGSNTGQIYSAREFGQVVSFNSESERTTLPSLSIHNEMTFGFDDDPAVFMTEGTAKRMAFDFSDDPAALLGINQGVAFDFMDDPAVLSSLGQGLAFDFSDDPAALLGINQGFPFDFNNDAAALRSMGQGMTVNGSLSVSSGGDPCIASGFADSVASLSWEFGQERPISLGGYFELPRNVVADFGCDSEIAVT
jgi:hypothetical protein